MLYLEWELNFSAPPLLQNPIAVVLRPITTAPALESSSFTVLSQVSLHYSFPLACCTQDIIKMPGIMWNKVPWVERRRFDGHWRKSKEYVKDGKILRSPKPIPPIPFQLRGRTDLIFQAPPYYSSRVWTSPFPCPRYKALGSLFRLWNLLLAPTKGPPGKNTGSFMTPSLLPRPPLLPHNLMFLDLPHNWICSLLL